MGIAADAALTTGACADSGLAIQRLGKDARQRGLTNSAGPGEQIGMVQPVMVKRITQGAHHVLLPHHFGEVARAPFTGKNLV